MEGLSALLAFGDGIYRKDKGPVISFPGHFKLGHRNIPLLEIGEA